MCSSMNELGIKKVHLVITYIKNGEEGANGKRFGGPIGLFGV